MKELDRNIAIFNARRAIANGNQAAGEDRTLSDLRTHYRDMGKGRPPTQPETHKQKDHKLLVEEQTKPLPVYDEYGFAARPRRRGW